MKPKSTHAFWVVILLSLSVFVCRDLYQAGFPQTVDGELHLARTQQVREALDQGQLPPFWAPNLNFGLGHPVLIMSYPLFTLLSQPLIALGVTTVNTTKLLIVFLVTSGGIGMYWWRRSHPFPAAVAAISYLCLPSIAAAVFNRGSVGEITAFGLFPWLAYAVTTASRSPLISLLRSLLLGLLLLSHNVTAVLVSPIILGLALSRSRPLTYWLSILLGIGLSLWFWIPALSLVGSTYLSESSLSTISIGRFRNLDALIGLGVSNPEILKPIPETLGWFVPASILLSLITLIVSRRLKQMQLLWSLVALVSIGLILPESLQIWQQVPGMEIIQHPIRLLAIAGIAGTQLAFVSVRRVSWVGLPLVAVSVLSVLSYQPPAYYLPYQDDILASFPLTTTAANELDPIWYQAASFATLDTNWFNHGLLRVDPDTATQVVYSHVDGSKLAFSLDLAADSTVKLKRLWFEGWQLSVDGERFAALPPTPPYGLVTLQLPSGNHAIELQLRRNYGVFAWGWILTGVSMVGMLGLAFNTRAPDISVSIPKDLSDNNGDS